MNEEQLKLIRDSLKTIQQTIQADLVKEAHTQRTKLDTLQSKLNKPDTHGLRGKHTLSASSVLNPRQFQHIACPAAVNLSMRNASYNVFGIPHFIRATDAHIAVAICFLLTPTPGADDLTAETHPPPGHYLYIFNYSSMGTLQHDVEEIAYDLFINPPLAPRPPGLNWDQVRAEREAQLRDFLGIDVNQDN